MLQFLPSRFLATAAMGLALSVTTAAGAQPYAQQTKPVAQMQTQAVPKPQPEIIVQDEVGMTQVPQPKSAPVSSGSAPVEIIEPAAVQAVPAPQETVAVEQAQTDQLTLLEALRTAYLSNPTLNAARAELKARQELMPQAQAGWKPTVTSSAGINAVDIDTDPEANSNTTATNIDLALSQPLYRGGRTMADMASARNTIAAQEAILDSTEEQLLRDVAIAYVDVLRDRELLSLSRNTRDIINRNLEATQDRFNVGELTKTDVSQAQARLARADSNVITAQGDLNATKARFEEITGLPAENLVTPIMDLPLPQNLNEASVQAEQTSPVIQTATYLHKASEEDIGSVFGQLLPEVGFNTSIGRTYDPSPGLYDDETIKAIGVSATIPLYEAGAVRSRVREAKHTANRRYLEIFEARRQVQQQVVSDWATLEAAMAEIESRAAQVEAATVAQEGVSAENEFGSRTILDVLDANQELLDAKAALVTAERNKVAAQFSILSTLGILVPENLGFAADKVENHQNYIDIQKKIFDMHVDSVQETD